MVLLRCLQVFSLAVMAFLLAGMAVSAGASDSLLDEVNTLQGTDSVHAFSHGNTLPLVGTPWGMTDWAPQTDSGPWIFTYQGKKIEGLRATHQPCPWMGDYGQFLLMPQTGDLAVTAKDWASPYDVNAGVWKPDYLRLQLTRYNVTAELTATERCSVMRLTFHEGDSGRLIVNPPTQGSVEVKGRKIVGHSLPTKTFGIYFVVELDRDVQDFGTFQKGKIHQGESARQGKDLGAFVNFKTADQRAVTVKVGTSFISIEQAEQNLRREVGNLGFDDVRAQTAAVWEKHLGRIEIEGGSPADRNTFYTCLYRALKYPHRLHEIDGAGKVVHRSPYDDKIHDGVLYTDNGFWDTFRCVYSFYSVVYPGPWREILQGWVQAYRENGWYPQWPSPGNRSCMIGTHIDAIIADAIVKGIEGLDLETAYAGLRKDATVNPRENDRGRQGLDEYLKRGYVPDGRCQYATSSGLDYAYDDWCVAQAARKLGKMDDYRIFMERAKNYEKSWDPSVGFMRARKADGQWVSPFDEFAWGGPYVEGGPWQCSWAVQHDVAGLIQLVGGPDAMVAKLDKMLSMEPTYHTGGYGMVIHEMREMAAVKFGQYDHGNQPGHHVLFLYAAAGQPWKTEYWTRKVCAELYNAGPQGFAGDEDNGEMACWYLLNTMGFYPLTPGRPEYVLTSPVFTKATIHLDNGRKFVITAPGNRDATVYVRNRTLNGQNYANTWIAHEAITQGGQLHIEPAAEPHIRPIQAAELPYSMSTHPDSDPTAWKPVFADDLSNAVYRKGIWSFQDGLLTATKDEFIWTKEEYDNFVLDLEFKNEPGSNSGVFVYCSNLKDPVVKSVEIQLLDDADPKWAKVPPHWRCGGIFGHAAPSKSAVKKPGEWNHMTITCRGPILDVVLNGETVTHIDMTKWTELKKTPDGSDIPDWYTTTLAKLPTKGRIGLQGAHGGIPTTFRNLKIQPLPSQ